jgi:hypothetical protein
MNQLTRPLAVLLLCFPIAAGAQSGLTYDLSLTEKTDGKPQASTGHVFVLGNNVRMDIFGPSSLGKINRTDFGDSIAIIATDTGKAQMLSIVGHKSHEYVQFAPVVMMEKMRDAMARMPGVPQMDFTGSTVTLDSLGPADDIAGYKVLLYRLDMTIKIAVSGQPVGEQDILSDYYIAPDLKDFTRGGSVLTNAMDQTGSIPGIPKDFSDKINAASKRLAFAMAVKTTTDSRSNLFGTGVMRSSTIEASNIKRADVPASTFVVPAGYKRIVPPGMEKFM